MRLGASGLQLISKLRQAARDHKTQNAHFLLPIVIKLLTSYTCVKTHMQRLTNHMIVLIKDLFIITPLLIKNRYFLKRQASDSFSMLLIKFRTDVHG